jgi:thiol-disulfide isomerase/thioredoxin
MHSSARARLIVAYLALSAIPLAAQQSPHAPVGLAGQQPPPIVWRVGTVLPDFAFTDLTTTRRSLSDYRGRYVLLDIWGAWCKPCMEDIPYLKAAYAKFHGPRFEIISLDYEDVAVGPDSLFPYFRAQLAMHAWHVMTDSTLQWVQTSTLMPQRRGEDIGDLIHRRFGIMGYPTLILIGPTGRVVSTGGAGYGAHLEDTLEQILSHEAAAADSP